jgi:hypothetical protein
MEAYHARQAHASGSARTFIACDGDRVAGYFSLTVGQIDTLEAPERVRRGMGQYPIPLIILARLAVDLDYQGRGWVSACCRTPFTGRLRWPSKQASGLY